MDAPSSKTSSAEEGWQMIDLGLELLLQGLKQVEQSGELPGGLLFSLCNARAGACENDLSRNADFSELVRACHEEKVN